MPCQRAGNAGSGLECTREECAPCKGGSSQALVHHLVEPAPFAIRFAQDPTVAVRQYYASRKDASNQTALPAKSGNGSGVCRATAGSATERGPMWIAGGRTFSTFSSPATLGNPV
jgi:hypothetical protein